MCWRVSHTAAGFPPAADATITPAMPASKTTLIVPRPPARLPRGRRPHRRQLSPPRSGGADESFHEVEKIAERNRLRDIAVAAARQRLAFVADQRERGYRHDRNRPRPFFAL